MKLHNGNRNRRFGLEGHLTCNHFVKHYANRINIGFFVGLFSSCLLGAYIVNRADCLIGNSSLVTAGKTGNTEIGNLNCSVRQNHNILGLNIAVNNTLIVSVLKSAKNLNRKVNRILPTETSLSFNILLKGNSLNVFHYNVLNKVTEAYVINLNYILVRKHCDSLGFIFETTQKFLI